MSYTPHTSHTSYRSYSLAILCLMALALPVWPASPSKATAPSAAATTPTAARKSKAAAARKNTPSPEAKAAQYRALMDKGLQLAKDKNYKEAIRCYLSASKLQPDNPDPVFLTAQAYLNDQKYPTAERDALRVFQMRPDERARGLILRLIQERCLGAKRPDFNHALELAAPLYEKWPNDPYVLQTMCSAYLGLNQPEKALLLSETMYAAFRSSVAKDSPILAAKAPPYLLVSRARVAVRTGHYGDLLKELKKSAGGDDPASRLDAMLAEALGNEQFSYLLDEGQKSLSRKDYKTAASDAQQASVLRPKSGLPYQQLSRVYERQEMFDKALEMAVKAFKTEPEYRSSNLVLDHARRLAKDKRYQEAVNLAAMLREWDPKNLPFANQIMFCYNNLEQYDKAIEIGEDSLAQMKEYLQKEPEKDLPSQAAVTYLVQAYYKKGELAEALEGVEKSWAGRTPVKGEKAVMEIFLSEMANGLIRDSKWEQSISYLRRALDYTTQPWIYHRQISRAIENTKGRPKAIDYLKEAIAKDPSLAKIKDELAQMLFNEGRYGEAEQAYRDLADAEKDSRRYFENIVNCLMKQDNYAEAAAMIEEAILMVELSDRPQFFKDRLIASLEEKHIDVLDASNLLDRRISAIRGEIVSSPTKALSYSRLGDLELRQGDGVLALGQHLMAAYVSHNADELADQALQLANAGRRAEALPYVEAVIQHFPTHKKIFQILETLIQLSGGRDPRRFAFSAQLAEAYREAEDTCRRIVESKTASPDMKAKAEFKEMYYHYDPLPTDVEMWRAARDRASALLKRPDLTPQTRQEIMGWIADIDMEHLEDPESAFHFLEEYVRTNADKDSIRKLFEAAMRLNPVPKPVALWDVAKQRKGFAADPWLAMYLGIWAWDAGQRDEALNVLREGAQLGKKYQDWFMTQLRSDRPDLARLLASDKGAPAPEDEIQLIHESIHEATTCDLPFGEPAVTYEKTRLILPPAAATTATVRMVAGDRPVDVTPPAMLARFGGERAGAGSGRETAAQGDFSNDTATWPRASASAWEAVWPPAAFPPKERDGSAVFTLTSAKRLRSVHEFEARRSMRSDPDGSCVFSVFVHSIKPFKIRFDLGDTAATYRVIQPASGYHEEGTIVAFDNDGRGYDDESGTTFTLNLTSPRFIRDRRMRRGRAPVADVIVEDATTTSVLAATGQALSVADPGRDFTFEIQSPALAPGGQSVTATYTNREIYRLGDMDMTLQ